MSVTPIREIAVLAPGRAVAYAGALDADAEVSLWHAGETGEAAPRATLALPATLLGADRSGLCAVDGGVAVRAGAASILILDGGTLARRHRLVHRGVDSAVAHGPHVVTAGAGELRWWNASTGELVTFRAQAGLPTTLRAWNDDRIAYVAPTGHVGFVAVAGTVLEPHASGHVPNARYLASTTDRIALAIGDDVWLWSAGTGAMRPLPARVGQSARFIGDRLALASNDAIAWFDPDGTCARRLDFRALVPDAKRPLYCNLASERYAVLRHGADVVRLDLDAEQVTSWPVTAPVEALYEGFAAQAVDGASIVCAAADGRVVWLADNRVA